MTTERERRKQQEAFIHRGDFQALMMMLHTRLKALETHTGVRPPESTKHLEEAVRRLENSQNVLADALAERQAESEPDIVKPAPPAPPPPEPDIPKGYEDLVRENEAWGDAEMRLLAELSEMRNKLMGGYITQSERTRLGRLEGLFARKDKIAVESVT